MSVAVLDKPVSPRFALFHDRNFRWLLLAYLIPSLGDMRLSVALPVLLYNATPRNTALAPAVVAGATPQQLFVRLSGGVRAAAESPR